MKKRITLVLISLCSMAIVRAQSKADTYFSSNYFNEAIHYLEIELQRKNADKRDVLAKLGESHYQLRNFNDSKRYFSELYDLGSPDSLTIVRMVDLYRNSCEYEKAGAILVAHASYFSDSFKENNVDFPQEKTSSTKEEVVLLDNKISGVGMGYSFTSRDELLIGNIADESADRLKENQWTSINFENEAVSEVTFEKLKALGISYPSIDRKNEKIYFSASSHLKKRAFRDQQNVLQLYQADFKEGKVSNIEQIRFPKQNFNYTHPAISLDGSTLYFTADLPDSYGGMDIYFSQKRSDGTWTDPQNAGAEINTKWHELTPYLLGDTLYFSSYGHQNFGGSDVFMAIKKDGKFSTPNNLGKPVNSCQDDFSYVPHPEGEYALFTSNRSSDLEGKDNLYQVLFPENEFLVRDELTGKSIASVAVGIGQETTFETDANGTWKWRTKSGKQDFTFDHPYYWKTTFETEQLSEGDLEYLKNVTLSPVIIGGKAVDDITGNPIEGVQVSLFEKDGDDWKLVEVTSSNEDGDWGFHARKDREYKVEFEKDKYLLSNEIVERFDEDRELFNEMMKRMNPLEMSYKPEKDLVMQIDNIYFDYNKASLRPESNQVLDKLVGYLTKNPTIKIELSAHTDCIGNDAYNLKLSQRRANSCKEYLLKHGIDKGRIIAKGYGKQKMIITDCDLQRRDDSAAQKNRRVEVKIL